MGRVNVNIDQILLDDFFHDPIGQPLREITRRAGNIQSAIRKTAPKRSGKLAASVRKLPPTFGRMTNTISIEIAVGSGTQTPYLGYVIGGTRPHRIYPKGAHYRAAGMKVSKKTGRAYRSKQKVTTHALRFAYGGGIVFRAYVNHPGTAANDFINRGLVIGFAQ